MAVGDIFRLSVLGVLHGQAAITTHHYSVVSSVLESLEALALCNAFNARIGGTYVGAASADYNLFGYRARQETIPPTVPRIAELLDINAPGTLGQPSLPTSVAVVLRERTGLAGRSFRGRFYMPAVPQANVLNSQLLPPPGNLPWTTLAGILDDQITGDPPFNGYTFQPVVFSRKLSIVSLVATNILSVQVDQILRQQRRREVGVGI